MARDRRSTAGLWSTVGPSAVVLIILLIVAGGGAALFINLKPLLDVPALGTPILAVAAFVTVTLLLLIATVIFRVTSLQNRAEALGMPEGSIRAFIAMSLVVIFAVVGVSIFYVAATGELHTSHGLTAADVDRLGNVQIIEINRTSPAPGASTPATYDVISRAELSAAGHDFGLQLLSTISTLVVAVAGFYFGAKSVSAATRATAAARGAASTDAMLSIVSPSEPVTLNKSNGKWQPVEVVLNVLPAFLGLEAKLFGDSGGIVTSTTRRRFTYTPSAPEPEVMLVFSTPTPYEAEARIVLTREEPS